jgi:hypothetical protein
VKQRKERKVKKEKSAPKTKKHERKKEDRAPRKKSEKRETKKSGRRLNRKDEASLKLSAGLAKYAPVLATGEKVKPKIPQHIDAIKESRDAIRKGKKALQQGDRLFIMTIPLMTDGRFTGVMKGATKNKYHMYGNTRRDKLEGTRLAERLGMSKIGTGFVSSPEVVKQLEAEGFKFVIARTNPNYIRSRTQQERNGRVHINYGLRDGSFRDSNVRFDLLKGSENYLGQIFVNSDAFKGLFDEFGEGIDEREIQQDDSETESLEASEEDGSDDSSASEGVEESLSAEGDDGQSAGSASDD